MMTLLGIDVGGSGSRAAILPDGGDARREIAGPPVEVRETGSTVAEVVRTLLGTLRARHPEAMAGLRGVGVGATGLASLVERPEELTHLLGQQTRAAAALAIDAVTAHLGALGGTGGAVTALGTGAITISHPGPGGPGRWHRVDGWGHLLGDRGGGAWVGRRGLEAALRSHDGLDSAGEALLAAGTRRFGPPQTWPAQLYPRPDRARILASFAHDVVRIAAEDPTARAILHDAGREAGLGAVAALDALAPGRVGEAATPDIPRRAALAGGLTRSAGPLQEGFRATLAQASVPTRLVPAQGDPLDGALRLARLAADGALVTQEGHVWA